MKIKKICKIIGLFVLTAVISFSCFACSCNKKDGEDDDDLIDPSKITVTVTADRTELHAGTDETATISVEIDGEGLEDKSYTLTCENMGSGTGASYVDLNDHVLSLKSDRTPLIDQAVKVVATSTVASSISGSVTITLRAQVVEGQVGYLTTQMLQDLGNDKITVSGTVEDVFEDYNNTSNNTTNTYDYLVKMEDGKWYGEWNRHGRDDKDIINYRRSPETIGNTDTHTLNKIYIDKNNTQQQKPVTDYLSVASVWEEQHLWNHLDQLGIDINSQWTYDPVTEEHIYNCDNSYDSEGNASQDMYLRTYLAYSLTPMLGNYDTLYDIRLYVEDGVITKMVASTEPYYGEDVTADDATYVSYTILTANFSEVGTTTVPDPQPFEADEGTADLKAALEKMQGATNYTFKAKEKTISAPSYSDDDYSWAASAEVSSSNHVKSAVKSAAKNPYSNTIKNSGEVGLVGWVTDEAVVFEDTSKYSATLDGNDTVIKYTGYKQISDEIYDYFEFNANNGAFEGKKQYQGNLHDRMPGFDFAAEVFECTGTHYEMVNGKRVYFTDYMLREPAITRDIALEVSAHSYARDAQGATYGSFSISLDENGDLYSITYPYSLVAGTYIGVIETTFSKVGTTTLSEGWDDEYKAREVRSEWSQFTNVMYYHADHDTRNPYDEIAADALFEQVFGNEASKLPKPSAFTSVFGDNMTECFFEWKEYIDAATGEKTYQDWISFNLSIDLDDERIDENSRLSLENHEKTISALTKELAKYGFTYSAANSTPGGEIWGSRYSTYINGNIMIRIENNKTRFFFVDVLPVGVWTLNKD